MNSEMEKLQPVSSGLLSENWCHSVRKFKKVSFLWKIDNFFDCPEQQGERFSSSIFPGDGEFKWRLDIYPRGQSDEDKRDGVSLFLTLASTKANPVYAKFKFSILGENKAEMHSRVVHMKKFTDVHCSWGTGKLVSRNILSGLLYDDHLLIYCIVEVLANPVNTSDHIYYPLRSNDNFLCNDIMSKKLTVRGNAEMSANNHDLCMASNELAAESWCHTERKLKVSLKWKIDNFLDSPEEKGEFLSSSTFSTGNDRSKWRLQIYPKGDDSDEAKDHVSLFLVLEATKASSVYGKFKFCILDEKKKEKNVESGEINTKKDREKKWGNTKFISENYLRNVANGLLHGDKLLICCMVEVLTDPVNSSGHRCNEWVITPDSRKVPAKSLSHDFGSLLESRIMSDVVLISAEKHKFPAHKVILGARSAVFAAMFKHDMKENAQNKVEIADITKEVLQGMLVYIYTDKVPKIENIVEDLLIAADKYGLDDLKLMCEDHMIAQLSVDRAAELLIIAFTHKADQLKCIAIDFLKRAAKDIMETDGWKILIEEHPHILVEIIKAQEVSPSLLSI